MPFDKNKFATDVRKELERKRFEVNAKINQSDLKEIGTNGRDKMLQLVRRGISPIANWGRFREYKWAGAIKQIQAEVGKRAAKKKVGSIKSSKYPYSKMGEFPNKKVRPVNLTLSGKFLDNLLVKTRDRRVSIGFFSEPYDKMEQGHREGANTQPQRPIIPEGNEQLNASVFREMLLSLDRVLKRKFGS